MNNMKRVLTAVALAGAALSIPGAAHAGNSNGAGDQGGTVRDQSLSTVMDAPGDVLFSGTGNTFAGLLDQPIMNVTQAAGNVGPSTNLIGNPGN
ncbi:hypothetical protein ACFUT3_31545 [Streptomyces cinereoruber]|uniref:hypothetical protein n=1 Tax=Streptomyces cinereoruber TaxID=67260 RepID=UPI003625BBBF